MHHDNAKKYLLGKPAASLDYPFIPDVAVFKVDNRMFATLIETSEGVFSNLKCDPREAVMLRDIFPEVRPGYHMNKTHWNTVHLDGNLPDGEIERMMDNSYTLVVKSLGKARRQALEIQYGPDLLYR